MNSTNLQVIPAPPSLMKSLMAGFDAISNHIGLILISITLDVCLWFFPRVRLTALLQTAGEGAAAVSGVSGPELLERLAELTAELNMLSALRTFPVGIPSLLAGRSPMATPIGQPLNWDVPSIEIAFVLWILFSLIGLITGTLYFTIVSQVALSGKVVWRQALNQWPWASLQVFYLSIFWVGLLSSTIGPFLCFLSILLTGGAGLEQFMLIVFLVFGVLLIWMLLPLAFSPHGIFVIHLPMWKSIKKGVRLTRATLPSTALFFLSVIVLSEGLRLLWNVPPDNSWWILVGMAGHAFITAGLLAASFIYYRDAEHWFNQMVQQIKNPVA